MGLQPPKDYVLHEDERQGDPKVKHQKIPK